jgi:uncharacterized protein YhfF
MSGSALRQSLRMESLWCTGNDASTTVEQFSALPEKATAVKLTPRAETLWRAYVNSLPQAGEAAFRFYEVFRVGDSERSADEGAALIKQGVKTATSSLLWEYHAANKPLPRLGSLSIVEDGKGDPVCIVETTWLTIIKFIDVDAQFAYEYGEWDRTLESWREHCWAYYTDQCRSLGRHVAPEMLLVCERFKVVYP